MPKNQSQKEIGQVSDTTPLYNSRITNTYLEYIKNSYPDLDIDYIFEYAGMTKYEVEDPAHWFTQDQTDRFQEILVEKTENPNIAREAGRYSTLQKGMGPAKEHIIRIYETDICLSLNGETLSCNESCRYHQSK